MQVKFLIGDLKDLNKGDTKDGEIVEDTTRDLRSVSSKVITSDREEEKDNGEQDVL